MKDPIWISLDVITVFEVWLIILWMPWCFGGKKHPDPECLGFRMLRFDLPWFYLIFQFWLPMPSFRNTPFWNALMFWKKIPWSRMHGVPNAWVSECLGFRMLRFDLPWFYLILQFWLWMPWFRNAPYWNALMFWGENYPDPECPDSCTLHFQMP